MSRLTRGSSFLARKACHFGHACVIIETRFLGVNGGTRPVRRMVRFWHVRGNAVQGWGFGVSVEKERVGNPLQGPQKHGMKGAKLPLMSEETKKMRNVLARKLFAARRKLRGVKSPVLARASQGETWVAWALFLLREGGVYGLESVAKALRKVGK